MMWKPLLLAHVGLDKPGVLSKVAQILSDDGISIEALSSKAAGGGREFSSGDYPYQPHRREQVVCRSQPY